MRKWTSLRFPLEEEHHRIKRNDVYIIIVSWYSSFSQSRILIIAVVDDNFYVVINVVLAGWTMKKCATIFEVRAFVQSHLCWRNSKKVLRSTIYIVERQKNGHDESQIVCCRSRLCRPGENPAAIIGRAQARTAPGGLATDSMS